jgi:hypothetical protein
MKIQPETFHGPYLKVIKTGIVCDFEGYEAATQLYDLKFPDGSLRRLHAREVEDIPPHEAHLLKRKNRR